MIQRYFFHTWIPSTMQPPKPFLNALRDRMRSLMIMQGFHIIGGPYVRPGGPEDYGDSPATPGLKMLVVECDVEEFDTEVG